MIKLIVILGFFILITSQQTTVTPKTQACSCSNLLNFQDCSLKAGCVWTWIIQEKNNSENSNTTVTTGQCINDTSSNTNTNSSQIVVTQCSIITNQTLCAQTKGCASFNNSCILFSGCSAYVQPTNSQCQAISNLCTSDGTRCQDPQICSQYTAQSQCLDSISISGAKSCKWVQDKQQCEDKDCSDAPSTYNSNQLCNGWITGCLTTGQGCTKNLGTCNTYLQAAGCSGMVGSDGPCTSNTEQGSLVCRPLTCNDAPNTLSTNADCSKFLSGCLTTGKGCVKTLQSCNSYQQTQTCSSLIGSEGPCTVDTTSSSTCRALNCTDAPTSLTTNDGCNQFLKDCVTTGQGCVKTLGLCSTYSGTDSQCNLYLGSDGKCKGAGSTASQCQLRSCDDAPKTLNSDSGCNFYQKGCVTNGYGCVISLKLCQQYTGTSTTCLLYKGSDGNCMAPSTQTTDGPCSVKVCSNAPLNINTNQGCQQYSYNCVTNGSGCIQQPTCETTQLSIVCEGNASCSSGQICLDRSSCTNYYSQSLCQLNSQQYKIGSKIYQRKCQWSTTCQNTLCSSLPSTLTTDQDCDTALPGCVSKGNGCVDINDNCASYQGLLSTCSKYKGINGTQVCTQLASETNFSTPCIAVTQCSQAKLYSSVAQTSTTTCDSFLKGCLFNGLDNCTNGDCTTYFGTQETCSSVNTAINFNQPQKCWKVDQPANAATACIPRTCEHAKVSPTSPFNTDVLCWNFMQGCVWNGKSAGGCTDTSASCSGKCYLPLPKLDCQSIYASGDRNQQNCQQFSDKQGYTCTFKSGGVSCDSPSAISVSEPKGCVQYLAIGYDQTSKNSYCQKIRFPNQVPCIYTEGDYCSQMQCEDILASGNTITDQQNYCFNIIYKVASGVLLKCFYDSQTGYCSKQQASCTDYTIPSTLSSFTQKFQFCITKQIPPNQYFCTYSGTSANCEAPASSCSELIPSNSDPTIKKMICYDSKVQAGNIYCQLKSDGTACEDFNCSAQIIQLDTGTVSNNLNKQQFCLKFQKPCSFDGNCKQDITCNMISTYGPDYATNSKFCQQYQYSEQKCAYLNGDKCKAYNCNDVTSGMSTSKCLEYHPNCQFDGAKCQDLLTNCGDYVASSNGSGKLANCMNLRSYNGIKCGYSSDNNCKNRQCADIQSGGSDELCASYINNCVFNGIGCQLKSDCNTYNVVGSSLEEKISYCTTRNASQPCTYENGQNKCIEAKQYCTDYQISSFSSITPQLGCGLRITNLGRSCYYEDGATCSPGGDCDSPPSPVNSESDCQSYKPFCKFDLATKCFIACSKAPTNIITNSGCAAFRVGCVTNGSGCIEPKSSCSDYKGTSDQCANFKGNYGTQPCGNTIAASATDSCQNRTCQQNNKAKSDQECDQWIPPNGNSKSCVWNGTSGCVAPQNCSSFQGTIDTCPKYTALDGPCLGVGTGIQACVIQTCNNAPTSYNTDAQCKSWGSNCITNGSGCIQLQICTNIANHQSCNLYQNTLGCDLAKSCLSKPQQCSDFATATECNNHPIIGQTLPGCRWNQKTNLCVSLTCVDLPLTLTSDQQCSQAITNCVTSGSGCILKAACSTYSKQVCGIASTTDPQKVCIWSNSVCRPIQCTDNTTANTDSACESYLTGCKSTGSGCGINLTCQQYKNQQLCNKDSTGNPCIWIQQNKQGSCINYTKCSDVISSSHKECQNISSHCTTNGTNCVAITSCAKTISQASCIIGTDGTCGWLPASGSNNSSCALFTSCTAAIGKTTIQCQAWSNTCISDGVSCISKSQCSSYQTQVACQNQGTDGTCIWIAQTTSNSGTCRLQLCSDAVTNIDTHTGCTAFIATTQCTTSGTGCIPLSTCSSYKVQAGCVIGTDGECFWQTANSTDAAQCRLKQCTDNMLTTSSSCLNSMIGQKCVSDGVKCIKQSTCSTYTTKEACSGGGSDGQCAFTPNSNSTNEGKCQLFQSCDNANQDQITCNSRQDSCYFNSTTVNGITTTLCQPHTCQTKALGSTCQPIPSFDLSTYQICVLTDGVCSAGSPSLFTAVNCYQNSVATYTWNPTTSKCSYCKQSSSLVNNTNNQTGNGQNTLLSQMLKLFIMMMIFGII